MSRPKILDLFCGAGGCSVGYHRAGFDVVGIDINPQPRYPFEFIQTDALDAMDRLLAGNEVAGYRLSDFAAGHGSPPCQEHSVLAVLHSEPHGSGWMLDATRERLKASGLPYVIENVEAADMPGSLVLCGTEFGLTTTTEKHGRVWLKRHRRFESNVFLWGAGGCNCYGKLTVPVYGHGAGGNRVNMRGPGVAQASREVMGIDWMTRRELDQAIPPAYTEHIGLQLLEHLAAKEAA